MQYEKVSIDKTLFIVDPWRTWFNFGFVGVKYRDYTYSYIAETQWKSFKDGVKKDDPFSIEEIEKWGRGVVFSHCDRYFEDIDVTVVPVEGDIHDRYQVLKEKCFQEEHTISAILKRLSEFANSVCPERAIPSKSKLFEKTKHRIVSTDLGIDKWLVEEIDGLVKLTNNIERTFHVG
jgi:hypothetical protein